MERSDVIILNQLINSLEETAGQLERANASQDYETFNKLKKTMLNLQKEIAGALK
jgi:uncharacterized protein YdcH (DUF465 family)